MNKLDRIIATVIFLFLISLWLNRLLSDIISSIFIAVLICFAARTIFLHITNRHGDKKTITCQEMLQCFALMGSDGVNEHLLPLFPESAKAEITSGYIFFTRENEKEILFACYRFSPASAEEIAKVYRFAKENGIKKVTLLSRPMQRQVLLLAKSLPLDFTYIEPRKVHKFLAKHNALPVKEFSFKKKREKGKGFSLFKETLSNIFTKKRAALFLISGISLGVLSIFTHLTVYYLVMASISLILAAICFFRGYAS